MRTSSRSRLTAVIPALALLLAVAGCASAPSGGAADPVTGAPSGDAGFQAARDAYDLRLAQCLRDAGFEVEDPQPGEGITETLPGIEQAASACMTELGDPPRPDATVDETEMLNGMLEWAECFRERGIEVVEPRLGEAFILPEDATDADVAACIPPV